MYKMFLSLESLSMSMCIHASALLCVPPHLSVWTVSDVSVLGQSSGLWGGSDSDESMQRAECLPGPTGRLLSPSPAP